MRHLFLAGRILLGGFFLFNGARHFTHVTDMTAYAAHKGVPAPMAAVLIAGLLLLVGGVSLLVGVVPRVGVVALMAFLVPVTLVMHAFWTEEGAERMADLTNFSKNVALMGSVLLLLAVPEPWPYSLGSRAGVQREARAH